jgi:FkbM family methyltransferase
MSHPDGSQYGEATRILEYFAKADSAWSRFLDIGAYDGITLSNTFGLRRRDWQGVLVEPDAANFVRLCENTLGSMRDYCLVNAGIAPAMKLREFWQCLEDIPSTFVGDRKEQFSKSPYRKVWACTITIDELLARVGKQFEFVNIDVEGLNVEVLAMVMQSVKGMKMLCVEIDPEAELDLMKRIILEKKPAWKFERIGGNLLAYE